MNMYGQVLAYIYETHSRGMAILARKAYESDTTQGGIGAGYLAATDQPWVTPPEGFIPFVPVGVIALPGVGVTANILSYMIPVGYDGVITLHNHNFDGIGFTEGSGDIIWRLNIDGRPVKNFSNMTSQYGSQLVQRQIPGGIRVFSGQTITYTVTHANNAGLAANIFAGISGYYYPRRKE